MSDASTYARADQRYLDILNAPPPTPFRTRFKAFSKRAAIVTLIAIGMGAVYEQVGEWQERRRFPQIGTSVDIGGRSLNIFCSGEGSPPVIFETGAGNIGYSWTVVQKQVAKVTRACWYDRAGYGWSDSAAYPRDSYAVARDLHQLLHNAGIRGPYLLVGHSIGGFHIRVFHKLFPQEVAGVVFVDASYEHEYYGPEATGGRVVNLPDMMFRFDAALAQMIYRTGLARVMTPRIKNRDVPKGIGFEDWVEAHAYQTRLLAETAKEIFVHDREEVLDAGNLGALPLLVLTAAVPSAVPSSPVEARRNFAYQRMWIDFQKDLTHLFDAGTTSDC